MRLIRLFLLIALPVALASAPGAIAQSGGDVGDDPTTPGDLPTTPTSTAPQVPVAPTTAGPAVESPEEAQGGSSWVATLGFLVGAILLSVVALLVIAYAGWRSARR